ncbi:MAG: hypothetical protein FWG44_04855 [Oscillospiraceae bacterium]|nr:hypothetical protein [Oscillospiraceae bacterium]
MKRIISLLLVITLATTLLLSACTSPEVQESGEAQEPVENVESLDLPEDVEEEIPLEVEEFQEEDELEYPFWVEGTYDYKGISFPGKYYYEKNIYDDATYERTSFLFDRHYLLDDYNGGKTLCQITSRAALAFISGDYKELSLYLKEDRNGINENADKSNNTLNLFLLDNVYTSVGRDSETITILYFAVINGNDSGFRVGMDVYLNDEGEWKIDFIDVC